MGASIDTYLPIVAQASVSELFYHTKVVKTPWSHASSAAQLLRKERHEHVAQIAHGRNHGLGHFFCGVPVCIQ